MEINWFGLIGTLIVGIPAIFLTWWMLFRPRPSDLELRISDAQEYRHFNPFSGSDDPTLFLPRDYVKLEYQYTETLTNTLTGTITSIGEDFIIIKPDTAEYGNMCGQSFTVWDWQFVKGHLVVDPNKS